MEGDNTTTTPLQLSLAAAADANLNVVDDCVEGELRPDTIERIESLVVDARHVAQQAYDSAQMCPMPVRTLAVVVAALLKELSDEPLYHDIREDLARIANLIGTAALGEIIRQDA